MAAGAGRERGFALLMVLWTLLLLAFIATVFNDNARTEVLLARNLVANARAEALADGGVYRAALGLTRSPREGGFRGDGQVYVWQQFSIRCLTSRLCGYAFNRCMAPASIFSSS